MSSPETIKLIQFRAAYNLPVHAGIETGIFARHGLYVETAYTPGSSYMTQALNEGRFDIGHTGADDIIAAVETDDRSDLFLFMGLHSGLFSVVATSDCVSIDSLRGKAIGVDAKKSGFALVLEDLLGSRGLARDDYRLVEIGGWEERSIALAEAKIAATLLTEPFLGKALRAGCHLLGRDFEMIPVYQGTCGATTRDWARRHPDRLRRYIRAYMDATQWCFAVPNRRLCLDILAKYNGIDGAAADDTLAALLHPMHGLYPRAALNIPGIAAAIAVRINLGYLRDPSPPPDKYVDLSYYRNAETISE
jgi:ABC-type nitrate/sulfonate/bicarbonate transport system substrate-binding protein